MTRLLYYNINSVCKYKKQTNIWNESELKQYIVYYLYL